MAASGYTALDFGVAARPFPGQRESGDSYAVIPRPCGAIVAVVDGLGHGYEAALAAKVAVSTLAANADLALLPLVTTCHKALARTRGAALSAALLEWSDESLTWIAVGNVAGLLVHANEQGKFDREHILMRGGIIGHRLPPLRVATLRLHRGDMLILATDGIREGFQEEVMIDAATQDIADRILARYGRATDDALVLVGKWHGPPLAGQVETDRRTGPGPDGLSAR